jgi:AcrR family transcriptional regulator
MGHREDLLDGAVRCLREKGYARTTARDIVAASGTNLASIGYHYGSTQALLNAAVVKSLEDFGTEMARAAAAAPGATTLERFERFWTNVIESFRDSREIWLATFDIFSVAQRDPEVRAIVADGLEGGRQLWAQLVFGDDARDVGSLLQALLSGVLVQWLVDPDRAPSARELSGAMLTLAQRVTGERP